MATRGKGKESSPKKPKGAPGGADPPVGSLSDIGEQGLVIFDGDNYYFVTKDQWQDLPSTTSQKSRSKVVVETIDDDTLFVNLDLIQKTPLDNA